MPLAFALCSLPSSAVVAAYGPNDAKHVHPSNDEDADWDDEMETWGDDEFDEMWVAPGTVVAERLGKAIEDLERGVILASMDMEEQQL